MSSEQRRTLTEMVCHAVRYSKQLVKTNSPWLKWVTCQSTRWTIEYYSVGNGTLLDATEDDPLYSDLHKDPEAPFLTGTEYILNIKSKNVLKPLS